ncbi:MFS transporter [Shimazuella kribbensis]|uniref:MFS transporter n=1 Tax=Shimazuella kribbensis TaxID=139808 RepID=UPI0004144E8A|nr:MFS transporter [Shimazuella kribbensis]
MYKRTERNTFLQIVFTLGISLTLVVSLMYVTIPLLPILEKEFQATSSQTVWVSSIYGFAYGTGCLIFGVFSDRFHRKSILIVGIFALIGATFFVSVSPSMEWLIALRALQGVIAASIPIISLPYVSDVLAPRYRPIAITIISSSFLLSGILGQLYGQVIGKEWGWTAVFLFLAMGLLIASFSFFYLPHGVVPKPGHSFNQVIRQAVKLFTIPQLVLSFFVMGTMFFSFVTMYSGLGSYVDEKFQIDDGSLMWIRIAGIPGIVLSLFASSFIRKYGAKTVLIAGLLIAACGLIGEAIAPSIFLFVLFSVIFVMGISIANPSMIVMVGLLGERARGSALAINAFFAFMGASFGSLLAEYINSFPLLCLVLILALLSVIVVSLMFIRVDAVPRKQKNIAMNAK